MTLNKEATQCKGRFIFQLLGSEVGILLERMVFCVGIIETLLGGGSAILAEYLIIYSCRIDSHWERVGASNP
jgi:hypothetical protein